MDRVVAVTGTEGELLKDALQDLNKHDFDFIEIPQLSETAPSSYKKIKGVPFGTDPDKLCKE